MVSNHGFAELNRCRSNGTQYEPILLSVRSIRGLDWVRARMLAGQVVEDWGKVSDRLCQTFGAHDCRVRSEPGRPHEIEAWVLDQRPTPRRCRATRSRGPVQLDGLPVGLREDGEVYRLPLLGNHLLMVGETGSGRSLTEECQPPKQSVPRGKVTRIQDPELRAAIENYAVDLAIGYYKEVGGTDVVKLGKPYDMKLTLDGQEGHVEVKGSSLLIETVELTINEVTHSATLQPTDLVVVDGIEYHRESPGLPPRVGGVKSGGIGRH